MQLNHLKQPANNPLNQCRLLIPNFPKIQQKNCEDFERYEEIYRNKKEVFFAVNFVTEIENKMFDCVFTSGRLKSLHDTCLSKTE